MGKKTGNVVRSHIDSDRYEWDFRHCTPVRGWAQLDSDQDAAYFGTWISARARKITNYCEGDLTVSNYDTDAELVEAVADIERWNAERSERRFRNGKAIGIDSMLLPALEEEMRAAGLGEYLH